MALLKHYVWDIPVKQRIIITAERFATPALRKPVEVLCFQRSDVNQAGMGVARISGDGHGIEWSDAWLLAQSVVDHYVKS